MIGKVIEGRYTGASVHKLPDKNILFIVTENGNKVALSKSNVISIDDITEQYSSDYRKVLMVMWNDFETSILQLGITPQNKPVNNTVSNPMTMHSQENRSHSITSQTHSGRNNGISSEKHSSVPNDDTNGRDRKSAKFSERDYSNDEKHRKPKKSVKQTRTDSSEIPSTSTVGVGTKIILLWLCVGLLLVGVFFKATVMNTPTQEDITLNQIEAFNALYDLLSQKESNSDYDERRKMIDAYTSDSGIDIYSSHPFDESLADAYIQKYSIEEFVEKLYTVYTEEYYHWECREVKNEVKCEYQMLNDLLMYALGSRGIEIMPVHLPSAGSAGYYAEHPEEVPESKVYERSGKFNSGSGADVYIDTRTCTTTGTAHGDFATMHEEGYSYDEGKYGWKNGKFYDVRPSWKRYDNTFYYYKGVELGKIALSTTQQFTLDGCTYFLLSPNSCPKGNHNRREWVRSLSEKKTEEIYIEKEQLLNEIKNTAMADMRVTISDMLKEKVIEITSGSVSESEILNTLTATYLNEELMDEKFTIDAVYQVNIRNEYIRIKALLTGNVYKSQFTTDIYEIEISGAGEGNQPFVIISEDERERRLAENARNLILDYLLVKTEYDNFAIDRTTYTISNCSQSGNDYHMTGLITLYPKTNSLEVIKFCSIDLTMKPDGTLVTGNVTIDD